MFSDTLLNWFDAFGRKDLPWQHPRSPYRVWISEIMLQQTQVKTVVPYFERFMQDFPDVTALANAPLDAVMARWSGLGYYSRARNLHKAAEIIRDRYAGKFPDDISALTTLPGIGGTTAAAIASQAFNQATAILDANVKRVFSRLYRIDGSNAAGQKALWQAANTNMPSLRCADYTQAIMDFGALLCRSRNPLCQTCPFQQNCGAFLHKQVHDFPVRKARKQLLTRERHCMLLSSEEKIYLVKNPPEGIWGGLWMLPSHPSEDSDYASKPPLSRSDRKKIQFYKSIKHSFSHFHLLLHIWHLRVDSPEDHVCEANGRWIAGNELSQIGLPGPVQQILGGYFNG